LKQYSPIAFRIFCLGVPFNSDVDFNNDRMTEAQNVLTRFNQFFSNVESSMEYIQSVTDTNNYERKWTPVDLSFSQTLFAAESILRKYLEDNFDTVGALRIISDVVREGNIYMGPALTRSVIHRNTSWPKGSLTHSEGPRSSILLPVSSLIQRATSFVSNSMSLFGVVFVNSAPLLQSQISKLSSPSGRNKKTGTLNSFDKHEISFVLLEADVVNAMASLRQLLRNELKKGDSMDRKRIFGELDLFRDKTLPSLGYSLKVF
jgi:hypothetical protein